MRERKREIEKEKERERERKREGKRESERKRDRGSEIKASLLKMSNLHLFNLVGKLFVDDFLLHPGIFQLMNVRLHRLDMQLIIASLEYDMLLQ